MARSARRAVARGARDGHERYGTLDVSIRNRQRKYAVDMAWLKQVAREALALQQVVAAEVCVMIVDDRRIATIHDEWFGDPSATDVITFDLSSTSPAAAGMLQGDIVVSAETAARIARELRCRGRSGWTPRHELAYYVVHGILHLTGYDDRSTGDRRAMRARERAVMQAIGLPAPPRPTAR